MVDIKHNSTALDVKLNSLFLDITQISLIHVGKKPDELAHYTCIDKNRIDFRNTNEQNHCAYQILKKLPLFISRREKSKQQKIQRKI